MLARPARRATYHRALRSGELIPQNERELRRSQGSASRCLAGNFHLTSVGGVYGGYRGIREVQGSRFLYLSHDKLYRV